MIQSVRRAMDIIRVISSEGGKPVPLALISSETGINKSTCAHILATMLEQGFVQKNGTRGEYSIGPAAFHICKSCYKQSDMLRRAVPVLDRLRAESGAAILFSAYDGLRLTVLYSTYFETPVLWTGMFDPDYGPYESASGRAVLSALPRMKLKEVIERRGLPEASVWPGVQTLPDLMAYIADIRERGLATKTVSIDDGYRIAMAESVVSASSDDGIPCSVICLIASSHVPELDRDLHKLLTDALARAVNELSIRL